MVNRRQRERFPRVGSAVANLFWRCKRVVRFNNQRDTAEQRIEEGKYARNQGQARILDGTGR